MEFEKSVSSLFAEIVAVNEKSFQSGAQILADAVENDRIINVIGTGGHSSMGAQELFLRAGSLANFNAILDAGVNLINGGRRSLSIERIPGYSDFFFDFYELKKEDPLIITNAYGINCFSLDVALAAKERGITTIGVTSEGYAHLVPHGHPARHPSGKALYQEVDVFIDCRLPLDDAVVEFKELPNKVAPVSTLINIFCLHSLVIATISECLKRGLTDLPIYASANMPEGDQLNERLLDKYKSRVKLL